MMTAAAVPGSFDPITKGHRDIISRASRIFDKVYVLVMTNTNKKGLFTPAERVELAQNDLADIKNVQVLSYEGKLTVDVLQNLGVHVIIRGVRNTQDYIFEEQMASMNKQLDPNIETLFMPASAQYRSISSSMIKEIIRFKGQLPSLVSNNVAAAIRKKYEKEK